MGVLNKMHRYFFPMECPEEMTEEEKDAMEASYDNAVIMSSPVLAGKECGISNTGYCHDECAHYVAPSVGEPGLSFAKEYGVWFMPTRDRCKLWGKS